MANVKEKNEVFKCNICGNIVEVLHVGGVELFCCGQPMEKFSEQSDGEEGSEKHIPMMQKSEAGIKVKVGATAHPMEERHYIEWIEIISDGKVCKKFLNPGEAPEADFAISSENIVARAYCNVHGLWKS